MLNIAHNNENEKHVVSLEGRLDTTTAPQVEEVVNGLNSDEFVVIDCVALEYISSAGLRALLTAQKKLSSGGGKLVIKNINDTIKEVFNVTGFDNILTIE